MEQLSNILSEDIHDIFREASSDLELTIFNLQQKALTSPGLRAKWYGILFAEKKKLNEMEEKKEKYLEDKVSEQLKLGSRSPKVAIIQQLEKHDPSIIQTDKIIKAQQDRIDFITPIVRIFDDLNYSIRASIDLLKLENQ